MNSLVKFGFLFTFVTITQAGLMMAPTTCPSISDACLAENKDIQETEKKFLDPDFVLKSLQCFLGNNTIHDCDELGMKNKMALPLAFNDVCLQPCTGYNSCVHQAGKRFLCQIRSFQPQVYEFLKKKFIPSCPEISEECNKDHGDIQMTEKNIHNPPFIASAMKCFLSDGLEQCGGNSLLIKNKLALPLAFNDICVPPCDGFNKCINNAGKRFLCIMENVQPIFYEALRKKYLKGLH